MSKLIDHILNEDFVSANQLFEQKISEMRERKLHELKRMMQAEAFGGLTRAEIEARKKAGWRKAADVLPDPRDIKIKLSPESKKVLRKKIKESIAETRDLSMIDALKLGAKRTKTRLNVMRHVPGALTRELGGAAKQMMSDPLSALSKGASGTVSAVSSLNKLKQKVDSEAGRIAGTFGTSAI